MMHIFVNRPRMKNFKPKQNANWHCSKVEVKCDFVNLKAKPSRMHSLPSVGLPTWYGQKRKTFAIC